MAKVFYRAKETFETRWKAIQLNSELFLDICKMMRTKERKGGENGEWKANEGDEFSSGTKSSEVKLESLV